ncbi:MAG: GNAT family N-acetyltransferase [Spirosomataceae bacterium]
MIKNIELLTADIATNQPSSEYRTVLYRNLCNNPAITFDFERMLFNEPQHLASQQGGDYFTFHLQNLSNNTVQARFSCFVSPSGEALSPFRATFGGIEWANQLSKESLHHFVQKILNWGRRNAIKTIRITQPPSAFNELGGEILQNILTEHGFRREVTELNQHLDLRNDDCFLRFHPSEKRRFRKCVRAGFEFKELSDADLPAYYELLVEARQRRNYPLSLSLAQLQALFQQFPQHFRLFGVFDGHRLIAGCVGVAVSERILYYFLPFYDETYRNFSPSVLLVEKLGGWAKERHFECLDLGISTVGGSLNAGLHTFKLHLGAIDSEKIVFLAEI